MSQTEQDIKRNYSTIKYPLEIKENAAEDREISTTHIILCCQGKKRSSIGKWEYV